MSDVGGGWCRSVGAAVREEVIRQQTCWGGAQDPASATVVRNQQSCLLTYHCMRDSRALKVNLTKSSYTFRYVQARHLFALPPFVSLTGDSLYQNCGGVGGDQPHAGPKSLAQLPVTCNHRLTHHTQVLHYHLSYRDHPSQVRCICDHDI